MPVAPEEKARALEVLFQTLANAHAAPDSQSLADALSQGLSGLPGVEKSLVCLGGTRRNGPQGAPNPFEAVCRTCAPQGRPHNDAPQCALQLLPGVAVVPARSDSSTYGYLVVAGDSERLSWLAPLLSSAASLFALLLGGRLASQALAGQRESFESSIEQQTLRLLDDERFLNQVFEGITDGLSVLDCDWNILRVNGAMEKSYASSMPLVGKKCFQAYHGRTEPCEVCPTRKALQTGAPAVEEVPYVTDGQVKGWIELSSYPMADANGRIRGVIEHVKNVTDRKLAEKALRASEENYRNLFTNAEVALFRTRIDDGLALECNDRFAHMFGYASADEIAGKVRLDNAYVDLSQRRSLLDILEKHGEAKNFECEMRRRDGRTFWTRGATRLRRREGYIEGVLVDITAQKKAEAALKLTQFAVDHAADAAYWIDRAGRFIYVNEAACKMYGYSRDQLLRMNVADTYPDPSSPRWDAGWDTTREMGSKEILVKKCRKDASTFPAEITINHVEFDGKEYHCCFARDISQHIALEEQLRQAQKMEAVGRLAGGIAHDFNNILQGILGTAEVALAEAGRDETPRQDLLEIRRGAQRAAELINQLLAFGRRQLLQPADVDLNSIVDDTLGLLRRVLPENISVATVLTDKPAPVHADPTQMQQVILNLCLNARDAMVDGGTLTIITESVEITDSYCRTHVWARPGDYLLLAVSDTGAGMDEETLEHIFEPFFTTKKPGKGTGLGLATVYGIVKQHDGMVAAHSQIGKGATISVYLPVARAAASAPRPAGGSVRGGAETILVAEDDEIIRALAKRILERRGYNVLLAADGAEALTLFRENAASVDVVFLDLIIPRMGGYEAFCEMAALKPSLKVIFASGYSINVLQNSPDGYDGHTMVPKPYSPDNLLRRIREVLDAPDRP